MRNIIKRKSRTSTSKRELAAIKRELKAELKSAREAAASARNHATQVLRVKEDVDHIIGELLAKREELLAKQEELQARQEELVSNLKTMETWWIDRVQKNVETVLANLRENPGPGPVRSGSRASPAGRVADQGLQGKRLPGSYESGPR